MINEEWLENLFSEDSLAQDNKREETLISLEAGFEQLETIVKALEQKDLPLEKALAYFKQGVTLVQHCSTILNQAEKQMQILLETPDGHLQLKPISFEVKG
ncbi:exodeoxyribonuclease VII small subunit [Desulfosporosinus sp. PR]|uniref:exodeoxyribonuclease VII small subunit n=1 Tax=Candidatus Desulfosporosinus nitrosoreducens TaxID=3401928 RepID=UPI0027EA1075|nr:exodeoxyribonuclease VII small subunit [Desulfosporosinus sp. PR]MDQ7095798.1 exodeoxyribonuclease VII small subunit [Desulfosporosinus sp. PR]